VTWISPQKKPALRLEIGPKSSCARIKKARRRDERRSTNSARRAVRVFFLVFSRRSAKRAR